MKLSTVIAFNIILILIALPALPVSGQASPQRGQLVLKAGASTGWEAYVFRPSVIYAGSSFKMWYTGEDNSSYAYDNIGFASSVDGVTWTRQEGKPVFKGGANGQWDAGSVSEPWVIFDGNEYKMWYAGEHYVSAYYVSSVSIGYATSPDGITWTRYSETPVLAASSPVAWDDSYVTFPAVIRTASGYNMYYRGVSQSTGVGQTGLATSADGIHWAKKGLIKLPRSGWDAYYTQYVSGVVELGNEYVAGYSGYSGPGTTKGSEIGFASSTDGLNWIPYAANPVVTSGTDPKDWDCCGTFWPVALNIGSNYYVYYTAWNGVTDQIGVAILPSSQYPIPEFSSVGFLAIVVMLVSIVALSRWKKARQ